MSESNASSKKSLPKSASWADESEKDETESTPSMIENNPLQNVDYAKNAKSMRMSMYDEEEKMGMYKSGDVRGADDEFDEDYDKPCPMAYLGCTFVQKNVPISSHIYRCWYRRAHEMIELKDKEISHLKRRMSMVSSPSDYERRISEMNAKNYELQKELEWHKKMLQLMAQSQNTNPDDLKEASGFPAKVERARKKLSKDILKSIEDFQKDLDEIFE
jgi:hypothetical protein